MNFRIKTAIFLILLCSIVGILFLDNDKPADNITKIDTNSPQKILSLRLVDNDLFLFEDDRIIKSYEINAVVLPSDDILILTNGIEVKDISEADSIAENFDG